MTPWERFGSFGASTLTWSPDGSLIAVTDHYNIFIIPAMGAVTPIRITNDWPRQFDASAWSPDGGQIAFRAWNYESHGYEVGVMNPDGSGVRTLSAGAAITDDHPAWSPDSARIAFTCEVDIGNRDICIVNRDGTDLVRLTNDPAADWSPVWSPDGMMIAFSTNRFGNGNVLALMNADGSGASPIGPSIAGWPGSWSPDGSQIAFTAFGTPDELCYVDYDSGELICLGYVPTAIYMTTPDGAVVTQLVDSGGDPAWMPIPVRLASFTFTCSELACSFDGSGSQGNITSYAWTYGDGVSGTGMHVSHTYGTSGTYLVSLTTVDDRGTSATVSKNVALNSPPVASFVSTCSALTCAFNAAGSSDVDGTIVSYAWNFGDGTTGSGPAPSHIYAAGGSYPVNLLVTDNVGSTATTSQSVSLVVAAFTSTCNGLTCTFDGSSSQGPVSSYAWVFGDGTAGSGAVVTHTYSSGGTYTASLTVVSAGGSPSVANHTVTPNSPPIASFTFTCDRLTCSFDGSGSRDPDGGITTYSWRFGDGTVVSGDTATHVFAAAGTYLVALVVTDSRGATGELDQNVTVTKRRVMR